MGLIHCQLNVIYLSSQLEAIVSSVCWHSLVTVAYYEALEHGHLVFLAM